MESKKTVAYIRVSAHKQIDNYSLEAQEQKVKLASQYYNLTLDKIYVEKAQSAKSLNRGEMKKLISSIEKREVDNLIICKLDRLSRSLQDLLKLIELCTNHDVNLISVDESINLSTASGRLLIHIIGVFAQFERENISDRTVTGLKEKARQGYYPWGITPYGYSKTNDHVLYTIDHEVAVIKEILKLYTDDNLSEEEVSNIIKSRFGLNISKRDVKRWLSKPIYAGNVIIKGEEFKIVEPIYTEEDWLKLKTRRKLVEHSSRDYLYMNKVYINGQICLHETAKKRLANGNIKYYTYYKIRNLVRIREETITKFIQEYYKLEEEIKDNKITEDVSHITELYINNKITEKKLLKLLEKAKNIEDKYLTINRIDITLNSDKTIKNVSVI